MSSTKSLMPFFLPYQRKWIEDNSRIKLIEKARQIGMSWTTAYSVVRSQVVAGSRHDVWVASRDEVQAKLFLEECRRFAKILQIAAKDLGERAIEEKSREAGQVLELANGTRIHSLSSNPDAQAGKRGTRVLDEFALHPDPLKLYAIAYPGITWGGRLEIISTHRGAGNFFNKLVEEIVHKGNPKKISHHRVTLQDALEQGLLGKIKQKLTKDHPVQEMDEGDYYNYIRASCADEESFLQEYMCQPCDDRAQFLSEGLIADCEIDETREWEININKLSDASGDFYLGIDIGRDHDLTVFWLIERVGDVAWTRKIFELKDVPFSRQEDIFYSWMDHPCIRRVCIDRTGIGRQFAERALEHFGAGRVEGITFTAAVKETLAYLVRTSFERKSVRIPSQKEVRADLRSVRKVTGFTGHQRIGSKRGKDGHADRFWALALSLHAMGSAERAAPPVCQSLELYRRNRGLI